MQCFCLTRRTRAGSNFRKRQRSFLRKQNGPGFGAISVLPCRLVATALLARDCAAVVPFDRCLYRKLDSTVMVMKSADDRHRYDAAYVLDGAMDRSVFAKRPMSPQLVIISGILRQDPA
jgi:hypothetical protein